MTDSPQHAAWKRAGSHWSAAQPVRDFVAALEAYDPNAEIGVLGDDAHLDHQPPEDHTPYSLDGPKGIVKAFDYRGRNADQLALRWINDSRAGRLVGVKYINFNGQQWNHEDGFQAPRPNSDKGHVHVSFLASAVYTSYATYDVTGEGHMAGSIWDEKLGGDTGWSERTFRDAMQDLQKVRNWLIATPEERSLQTWQPGNGSVLDRLTKFLESQHL